MSEISKTLDQGLEVLKVVADDGPGTVADLAERTGLNRTVVHRLVATLERRAYLQRDADGAVTLGISFLELSARTFPDLRGAAQLPLRVLAGHLQETAVLSIADGGEAVSVDQVRGHHHLVQVDYRPGFRYPLAESAHGRAILAFRNGAVNGRRPAPDEDDSDLAAIRRRGYAVGHDELGANGIAAPVFDATGQVLGSIGILAPVDRGLDEIEAARRVVEAAAQTAANLRAPTLSRD